MTTLGPETIFHIGSIGITNTLLTTALLDVALVGGVYFVSKNVSLVPHSKAIVAVEALLDYFHSLTEQISGKYVKQIFPWFASFFLFIAAANLMGLLPGFGSVGFFHETEHGKELIPILRGVTSDFNATLALATISLVATHFLAIKYNGLKDYILKFVSLNPVLLFVGALELISEGTKLLSFSFRLFGNIYAGEVALSTISSLLAFIAPIPFMLLETIVAFVQALVFAMLTMVFMSILIMPHHVEEGGEH